jgi:hypothetical protein
MPGFPIRTSSDHSSVGSSPRLIAASHVLHRLLMPRHSPHALNNLHHKNTRNHCTVLKHHTTNHPTTHHNTTNRWPFDESGGPGNQDTHKRVLPQDPTVCQSHRHHNTTHQGSITTSQPAEFHDSSSNHPTHKRCGKRPSHKHETHHVRGQKAP